MLLAQFANMLVEFVVFGNSSVYALLKKHVCCTGDNTCDYASSDPMFQSGLSLADCALLAILRTGNLSPAIISVKPCTIWPPVMTLPGPTSPCGPCASSGKTSSTYQSCLGRGHTSTLLDNEWGCLKMKPHTHSTHIHTHTPSHMHQTHAHEHSHTTTCAHTHSHTQIHTHTYTHKHTHTHTHTRVDTPMHTLKLSLSPRMSLCACLYVSNRCWVGKS